jgi:hypothetical protein
MIITSAGIYGFLSNAYSTTSGKLQNIEAQTKMVEQKKTIVLSEIKRLEETKDLKSQRVKSLTNLRTQQESRLDSLYNRRQIGVAKRVESQIDQANKEIVSVNVEIDSLNARVQRKYAETTAMDMEVLELGNNDVAGDVGPLKYIAKLTGRDMDQVVNFFILLLIFVFDPLAVLLIIATNISIEKELGRRRGLDEAKNDGVNDVVNDAVNDAVIKDEKEVVEGVNEGVNEGEMTEAQMRSVLDVVQRDVADMPIEFLPPSYRDIGAIFAGVKQVQRRLGGNLGLVIVDYLGLIKGDGKSRYEEITNISIALKGMALQLKVPVLALSQLSRAVESRDDKRPQLSDLRESGQLEQDADTVMFCYRDEYYLERERPPEDDIELWAKWDDARQKAKNRLEVIVAKQRQGEIGTAHMMFNPALNTIWDESARFGR